MYAEDATQESFVVAYRRLADLEDPQKFPSWLYSIALNVVRKWLRKRKLMDRGISRLAEHTGRATEYAALGAGAGHVGLLKQALSVLSSCRPDRGDAVLSRRVSPKTNCGDSWYPNRNGKEPSTQVKEAAKEEVGDHECGTSSRVECRLRKSHDCRNEGDDSLAEAT